MSEELLYQLENRVAVLTLNRPERLNALTKDMMQALRETLAACAVDDAVGCVVLTGAGGAFCSGGDVRVQAKVAAEGSQETPEKRSDLLRVSMEASRLLHEMPKPTIAMVNGFCFGGGFTQLIACDFAIAAEDAKFGLSEVNWGILPGGFVSKALTDALGLRDAVWLAMTGETFDAKKAEHIRLINKAVPRDKLREETISLAQRLMKLNPEVLKATKIAVKNVRTVPHEQAADYLQAKSQEMRFQDKEGGRAKGMSQFLDDKSYRPGYGPYARG